VSGSVFISLRWKHQTVKRFFVFSFFSPLYLSIKWTKRDSSGRIRQQFFNCYFIDSLNFIYIQFIFTFYNKLILLIEVNLMTIKKRLFISNLLMIVIPVIVAIITFWISFLILNHISNGMLIEIIQADRETRTYPVKDAIEPPIPTQIVGFIGIIAALFFTNLFLTRFVFKKIKQPLELLSVGARQISEGNLSYKILYYENDEFKPVCEDFNNMVERLKVSIEEAQKNEQSRKELLAGISHDLRSPLTSIKGFVEGLLDGVADTPESQREYLQIINQKTDDINNMVSQLFFYSKMDMGSYPIYAELLNIRDEINDFLYASTDEYKAKGLLIEVDDIPCERYICADPIQLRSVFANILDNSAKYKSKDTSKVSIKYTTAGGVNKITFEDDGPGVHENILPKLFDVFYRSDPSRNNPNQGSGLGLAIAAKALERMGGTIIAENIKSGGLRIIIEIPEKKGGIQSEENADN